MTHHQLIEEAKTKIEESIDSIRKINGDSYAKIVTAYLMGMHLTKMVATYCQHLPERQVETLREQLLGTLAFTMDLIVEGFHVSDKTEKEMMDWAQKLCTHIDHAYTQLQKG